MKNAVALSCLALTSVMVGQTRIDLKTQTKQIDLANADWTRPVKTGTALPAVCMTGELFFLTTAPAGQNLHGCVAENQWSALSSPPELPDGQGNEGKVLVSMGEGTAWAGGDIAMADGAIQVNGLRGREVSATAPTDGDILVWNQTLNQWSAGPISPERYWMPSVRRTSDTTLTIGAECLPTAPCRVRFGNKVHLIMGSSAVTLLSGTGMLWISVSQTGAFQAGYSGSMTLTCNNCTLISNASGFASQSLAVWKWRASTERKWDNGESADMRAVLGREAPLLTGSGLIMVEDTATGARTLQMDTAVVQTRTAAQSGAGAWCSATASANAYSCTVDPVPQSYTAGMMVLFQPATGNTGAATLDAGAGAVALKSYTGAPLQPAELRGGEYYQLVYTGGEFRVLRTTSGFDDTSFELTDEFAVRGASSLGSLGWTAGNVTGSAFSTGIEADASEPGYARLATDESGTATQTARAAAYLRSDPGVTSGHTGLYLAMPGWAYRVRVRILDAAAVGGVARIGFGENLNALGSNSLYVRYESGTNGDSWALYSGSTKLVQSTMPVASGVWGWISVSSTVSGSLMLQVDGETPQEALTFLPAVAVGPVFDYEFPPSAWSSKRGMDIGKWTFRHFGIVR